MLLMKHSPWFYCQYVLRQLFLQYELACVDIAYWLFGFKMVALRTSRLSPDATVRVLSKYGAQIGRNTVICNGLIIHNAQDSFRNLCIGSNCHIGRDCFIDLREKVLICDFSVVSMRTTIITHTDVYHSDAFSKIQTGAKNVHIGEHVYIGAGSTILMGVIIGGHTVIGASSLVNKSIESNCVASGVPVKVKKVFIDEEKLS